LVSIKTGLDHIVLIWCCFIWVLVLKFRLLKSAFIKTGLDHIMLMLCCFTLTLTLNSDYFIPISDHLVYGWYDSLLS
jgi:hypothetical protein